MHLRVALAADHAGFELKERLLGLVGALGHEAVDLGTDSLAPVDYPDFAMSLG
jgi:ribose 5-phosphate isomerase B